MRSSATLTLAVWLTALIPTAGAAIEKTEISFDSGAVTLAGTLLEPDSVNPVPGLVLVHGSGPGERSELLDVATRYAGEGFAVLVYDKRGSGNSGDSWITSSLDDLAEDAAAAWQFLVDLPSVDADRAGFWGISQGGWIVPLAANKTQPAFAVVVTGGGLPPREVELARYRGIVRHVDASEAASTKADQLFDAYFGYLAGTNTYESLMSTVDDSKTEAWFDATGLGRVIPDPKNRKNWAWVATFEPRRSIETLTTPVLVLLGGKDPLTPTGKTAQAWREALPQHPANSRVIVFPNAGHGMRTGGHGGEYAPDYFKTQFGWLKTIGVLPD